MPRLPVVRSEPYESVELLKLYETGPLEVDRDPKEIAEIVKEKPLFGVMVNSKYALPLEAVFNAPTRAAAPALEVPEAPVYADDTDVVVSKVVVPLLFPCETAPTDIPDGTPEVGVAVAKSQ